MHLNRIFLFLLIQPSACCFSQDSIPIDVRDIMKVTFFDAGISYEKRIGKLQSLYAKAFLNTNAYLGYSSTLGNMSSINFYPALGLQYRFYYNGKRRQAKGKRIEMNSLNYLGAMAETSLYRTMVSSNGEKELRASKIIGVAWGLQRNYVKRFSVDLTFGLGYVFSKQTVLNDLGEYSTRNVATFTNLGHIGLGFWLNRRN